MSDQLRERFDALRDAAAQDPAGGLPDVRARRTRRTRNRVAMATAGTVAALALGGILVLPQLDGDSTTSAGGAVVLDDSSGAGTDQGGDDQVAAENGPSTAASPGPLTVDVDSLLTAPELAALGEQDAQPQNSFPGPVFPPLCDATTSAQQFSDPLVEVGVLHVVSDATISQYAAEYGSDIVAIQAMDRLLTDARSCGHADPSALLSVTSRVPGTQLVLSLVEPGAGPSGSARFTDITIQRSANVVVEVALIPVPTLMGPGGESRTRTLADALAAKL